NHQTFREYYDEHPDEFLVEDRVAWQDIFIDADRFPTREAAKARADEVTRRARGGEDFVNLAATYNQGVNLITGNVAVEFKDSQGAEIKPNLAAAGLGQRRGEIQPREAEEALFNMKPGDIGPIVELATGYHIIRVAERDYAGQKPFDQKTQLEIRK